MGDDIPQYEFSADEEAQQRLQQRQQWQQGVDKLKAVALEHRMQRARETADTIAAQHFARRPVTPPAESADTTQP